MIEYFGKDTRRINHALKVNAIAMMIARDENMSDELQEIVQITSLLHDIGIKNAEAKYGSCDEKYQQLEGPLVASEILKDLQITKSQIDRILFIIGNHHSYNKIDGLDFQILVEADFLVNIDEDKFGSRSIISVRQRYFKTKVGLWLLSTMFS